MAQYNSLVWNANNFMACRNAFNTLYNKGVELRVLNTLDFGDLDLCPIFASLTKGIKVKKNIRIQLLNRELDSDPDFEEIRSIFYGLDLSPVNILDYTSDYLDAVCSNGWESRWTHYGDGVWHTAKRLQRKLSISYIEFM